MIPNIPREEEQIRVNKRHSGRREPEASMNTEWESWVMKRGFLTKLGSQFDDEIHCT